MTQFDKLVEYTNNRIKTSGFKLSKLGIAEMQKRFNKSESNGGYSDYWHNL